MERHGILGAPIIPRAVGGFRLGRIRRSMRVLANLYLSSAVEYVSEPSALVRTRERAKLNKLLAERKRKCLPAAEIERSSAITILPARQP